ncbi:arylsulfatase [Pontibacter sp. G13]|uniref:arylsulfatase n=1 Tax=Pontibacter sp. G13 TaxID=3074898 RepID=UPI00288BB411|nr:arylsulfatase [Pontibacter sp. G13]WNJ17910.1 arylsulfatase [Pontibacter sp. G13]
MPRHYTRGWMACWMVLLLIGTGCSQTDPSPTSPPNIVLIMVDDMGYSDIGPYGGEIPTPTLDRLAADGIRFSQFYNTSRCCPTRASLLTGLYQHQAGIGHMTSEGKWNFDYGTPGFRGFLNRNCVTLAEALKPAGYHTFMTGKWHVGSVDSTKYPLQRGFDKFYGVLAGAFSYFWPHGQRGLMYQNTPLSPPDSLSYYTTDVFTDSAISFIDHRQDDNPFFLYLAYNAPHWPLHAKEADIEKFVGKYQMGWDSVRNARLARQQEMGLLPSDITLAERDARVRPWSEVPDSQRVQSDYRMAVYAAQIHSVDENIGKLVRYLESKGQLDNTLIMFLSDNGGCAEPYKELGGQTMAHINRASYSGSVSYGIGWANASNTPFDLYKTFVHEGGVSTPFIAHWPDGIKLDGGSILHGPAHLIDVMPTVVDLAGASYPTQVGADTITPMEGQSLRTIFETGTRTDPEYLYFEHRKRCAIRAGKWKALAHVDSLNWSLYDLSIDRIESHDVAADHPEVVAELGAAWLRWAERANVLDRGVKPKKSYN